MVKLTQVKTRELFDFFKAIYKCVTVYEQLAACFGNFQVVLKERLDRHERFAVKRFKRTALEHLLKEHFAKSCGQLID